MTKIPEALKQCDRHEVEALIDRWVIWGRHSERNRALLKRSMLDGIPFEPLSEEFGLSVDAVKQAVRKSKEQLFAHIK
jgi:DNA-directed RNA polymerase specialized sigma24 family protein